MNILINLPPAFFATERFAPMFARLEAHGTVRRTSHNEAQEIADDLAWADAVIMWSWPVIDGPMLDAAGGLDFLGQIDTTAVTATACLERDIPVLLNKRGWSPAVAEMALGLMLSGLRRISTYHEAMRAGSETWAGLWPEGVDPRERLVEEVSVGLVGFGGVGQRLRQLLQPFGCPVRIVDPFIDDETCRVRKVERVDLETMLTTSDVVVLCAAANSGTEHLIGAEQLALMRDDALLINVARAMLVDTDALVAALQGGRLHACIDVFDSEPLAADHPLRACPQAYLTPHRAGGVLASGLKVIGGLIDDLESMLCGRQQLHRFTAAMLPALDG